MDKYLKQILRQKELNSEQIKSAEVEIKKLRAKQGVFTKARNKAREEGDERRAFSANTQRNKIIQQKEDLLAQVEGEVVVEMFNDVKIKIDKEELREMKDAESHIIDQHIDQTKQQIFDLVEKGKIKTAKGLASMLSGSYPENEKLLGLKDEIEELAKEGRTEAEQNWEEIFEGMEEKIELDYNAIYTVSKGGKLKVVYARKIKG